VGSPNRAILFDFGGTLDHPRHWLDRFVRHYHAAGVRVTRAELDVAYSHATQTAYQAGDEIHRHNLRDLVRLLVSHQVDHLHSHGPDSVRDHLAGMGQDRSDLAHRIAADFAEDKSWEVVAEAIQTLMRRYNLDQPYEQLKELTRGRTVNRKLIADFIATLPLNDEARAAFARLEPKNYIGLAAELVERFAPKTSQ